MPNESLGPQEPPFEGHGQPMPQQEVPQTTKPSQLPEGSNPMPPGGMAEMPMGMSMSTVMPSSPQFDPGSMSTDPVGSKVNAVAILIQRQNPEMDPVTVRRVARKVVGRLVTADWGWHPHQQHIEDPLAHPHPKHPPHAHEEEEEEESHPGPPVMLNPHAQQPEEPEEPRRNEEEDGDPYRHTEEPVDLTEFDHPLPKPSSLPHPGDMHVWPPKEGSLHTADWGWQPMEQTTEIPSMSDQQDQSKSKQDKGGGGDSSLPSMPGIPKLPGMGGGAGGGAAAGEAGGAAVAEEALPLLLV